MGKTASKTCTWKVSENYITTTCGYSLSKFDLTARAIVSDALSNYCPFCGGNLVIIREDKHV